MLSLLRKYIPVVTLQSRCDRRAETFARLLAPAATDGSGGEADKRPGGRGSVLLFEAGELPNVIQFLTMSQRTGQLYLEFPHLELQGNMFIRNGEIYAIYFGPDVGLEALAAMCNCGCGRASLYAGQEVNEINVDLPAGSLLVEAVVRADERLSDGLDGPPPEGVSLDDLEPVSGAQVASPSSSFMAGLMLTAKVGAVIGVFLAAFITNYFGYETLQEIREQRTRERARWEDQKHEQRLSRMRRKAVKRWYTKAQAAYRDKNYAEAANLLEITLRIDAGYRPAAELAAQLGDAKERLMLIPIQSEAEVAITRIDKLESGQGLEERVEALKVALKTAAALAEAEEYGRAAERYHFVIDGVESLEAAAQLRVKARAARDRVMAPRTVAANAESAVYAPSDWELGRRTETTAAREFHDGNFARAIELWENAAGLYREAKKTARSRKMVETARLELTRMMDDAGNQKLLKQYADDDWRRVRATVAEAEELQNSGKYDQAGEKWRTASALFSTSLASARKIRNKIGFETSMRAARQNLQARNWEEAAVNFDEALAIPGYEESGEAARGSRRAKLELAMVEGHDALEEGQWIQAKEKADFALGLDPDNRRAKALLAEAEDLLTPRLTVHAEIGDDAAYSARVEFSSRKESYPTPVTFKLEKGRYYAFTITAPPRGYIHYAPQNLRYHANDYGPEEITVKLARIGAPDLHEDADVPGLDIALAPVPAGSFQMGSRSGRREERPVRSVKLTRPWWISKFETTNADYREFLRDSGYNGATEAATGYLKQFNNGSDTSADDRVPVGYVSWNNAVAFCKWLTRRERLGGRLPEGYVYRLPTEAEWEYACRAGGATKFSADPEKMAHYAGNAEGPQPVGTTLPNPWNIFDMHGNMWEMCYDTYAAYSEGEKVDPVSESGGQFRVIRGGGWTSVLELCRSTYRSNIAPGDIRRNLGFRVVLAPALD